MSLVLGIDTGGTYTDGVVFDRVSRQVLAKAKSRTTREDLSIGITGVIDAVQFDELDKIEVVSMSTTLATNAIVEGSGCEVGLLLLGYHPDQEWDIPAAVACTVPGGHNVKGLAKEPFDDDATREALESMRGSVDAVAISGYLSVRNPEHEIRAKELVTEVLGVPTVCAHDLTRSLGIYERTTTAVLNAKLMPIIANLLKAVRSSLDRRNIKAPIMVVRGDGTLIGEEKAKDKPIETMLSGPAASIIGASFLSEEKDAFVFDMGGTTSDVAVVKDGIPRIDEEGAYVGGFLTRVKAAAISTFGLGGDSYIWMDMERRLNVGPQRVIPIAVAVSEFPYLYRELEKVNVPYGYLLNYCQVVDCFRINNTNATTVFNEMEKRIISALEDGPHNVFEIADRLETLPNMMNFDRLVSSGVLGRISVTPTDLLHADDTLSIWDTKASKLAVTLLAKRFNKPMDEFLEEAKDRVVDELCYAATQSLVNYEGGGFDLKTDPGAAFFFKKQLHPDGEGYLSAAINPKIPLIGVGAPIANWLPPTAERIGCRLVVPNDAEVANAIGSAVGRVMESVKILVTPGDNNDGFNLHSAYEMKFFADLEEAIAYAMEFAENKVREIAQENGVANPEITVNRNDVYAASGDDESDGDIYIETNVEAIATDTPEWETEERKEHFFVDTRGRGMTMDD
ncbi:MAG: hydantoinase/oxoprolinase family protein [Eggerthellaceae bacterium]|nr:hydantoinase/oxoprolinase family protein [Eggerthellaceae bacterium]